MANIQHSASCHAVFATRPHPLCYILSYSTRNGALNSMYTVYAENFVVLIFVYFMGTIVGSRSPGSWVGLNEPI